MVLMAVINAIEGKKDIAYQKRCVVCQKKHLFQDCDVLKNVPFLTEHYIRYCIQLRKEENACAKANPNEKGPIPFGINFLDTCNDDSDSTSGSESKSDSSSSKDTDSDTDYRYRYRFKAMLSKYFTSTVTMFHYFSFHLSLFP